MQGFVLCGCCIPTFIGVVYCVVIYRHLLVCEVVYRHLVVCEVLCGYCIPAFITMEGYVLCGCCISGVANGKIRDLPRPLLKFRDRDKRFRKYRENRAQNLNYAKL